MAVVGEDCDLFVKNLPKEFTEGDKEALLQYFGAKHVVCMGARGKLVRKSNKYCLFSDRPDTIYYTCFINHKCLFVVF